MFTSSNLVTSSSFFIDGQRFISEYTVLLLNTIDGSQSTSYHLNGVCVCVYTHKSRVVYKWLEHIAK